MSQPRTASGPYFATIHFLPAIALLCILSACSDSGNSNSGGKGERLIPAVEAVQARYGSLPLTERLSGAVKAKNQVELYPQISAAIVQVYVQNGSLVNDGDPLVRLRDTEFQELLKQAGANLQIASAQAKQAEAEYKRLRSELERNLSLADKNLISSTELEVAQSEAIAGEADAELARARVQQARATVDERKEQLSRTIIRAPIDGTVGTRNAEVGMLVSPNTRLFTIGQLDSVRVEVVLTDRMLSYIKTGQRSDILSHNLPFGSVSAPVARISPFLHPVTHSTIAEIELANLDGELKPGGFVTVDIFYGESENATIVPLSALWENPSDGSVGVFVTRDSLTSEPVATLDIPQGGTLTDPVQFKFIPIEVIAKGRMHAGVRGVNSDSWVVTIGQDLLGSDSGQARVRPVTWDRVEKLQQLQREDMLDEIIQRQQSTAVDTSPIGLAPTRRNVWS